MDMLDMLDMRPSAGRCFRIEIIVVFIFNAGKKHHFGTFVKEFFPGGPLSRGLSNGRAVLD